MERNMEMKRKEARIVFWGVVVDDEYNPNHLPTFSLESGKGYDVVSVEISPNKNGRWDIYRGDEEEPCNWDLPLHEALEIGYLELRDMVEEAKEE